MSARGSAGKRKAGASSGTKGGAAARSAHTPGPWKAEYRPNTGSMVFAGDTPIISLNTGLGYQPTDADLRLILAAPDLAAAAGEVLRFFGKWPEFVPAPDFIGKAHRVIRRLDRVHRRLARVSRRDGGGR